MDKRLRVLMIEDDDNDVVLASLQLRALNPDIPIVKRLKRGPPTTPNNTSEACKIPPRNCAKKAPPMQMMPKTKAMIFETVAEEAFQGFFFNLR